jgi:putative transposase
MIKRHGAADEIVTNRLRSYGAALRDLAICDRQETGSWANNRPENSRQPFRRRERAMLRFLRMLTLQKFASVHASIFNHFNKDQRAKQQRRRQRRAELAHHPENTDDQKVPRHEPKTPGQEADGCKYLHHSSYCFYYFI